MARTKEPFQLTRGFYGHLATFVVTNLAFVVLTLSSGGDFWWWPVTVVWVMALATHALIVYVGWREGQWTEPWDKRQYTPEQQDERDWARRHSGPGV